MGTHQVFAHTHLIKSGEITGAWIEMTDDTVSFGAYAHRLNFRLRARKDEKARRRSWLNSPLLKACESCGQFPAELRSEENLICQSCRTKRQESQRVRDGQSMSRFYQLLDYAEAKGQWRGFSIRRNAPEDFNDIGKQASPVAYLGFVYCDGNRMSELLSQLQTRDGFSRFSFRIRETLHEATFDALFLRCLEPSRHVWKY